MTSQEQEQVKQEPPIPIRQVDPNQEQWDALNRRRVFLIEKKHSDGLIAVEQSELASLEEQLDQHLDKIAPLPFQALEEFEKQVRNIP